VRQLAQRGANGKVVIGVIRNQVTSTPLGEVIGKQEPLSPELFELARAINQ
jgi:hypothetical protein